MKQGAMYCPRCGGTGLIPDPRYHGNEARRRRKAVNVTLREMARRMNLSAAYISDLELGRRGWNDELTKRYIAALKK
jgi:transcriptional regulator with XRE-family HTH domain